MGRLTDRDVKLPEHQSTIPTFDLIRPGIVWEY